MRKIKKISKKGFRNTTSFFENMVEIGFIGSAVFWAILIGVYMFQEEISFLLNINETLIMNILSFSTLFYLLCTFIHFIFSVIFVIKKSDDDYVVPSLLTSIIMFMVVLFV